MSKLKVMSVFGTRPEAIKMAPLALELQRRESLESLICVTAQHREMLDSVMHCFGLKARRGPQHHGQKPDAYRCYRQGAQGA